MNPILIELHWLKFHGRIILKNFLLTYGTVYNTAPEYLSELIGVNLKSTTIRTRAFFDPCLICVLPISKIYANSFVERSFMYAATTLWNDLDLDIRLLSFDDIK